MLTLKDFKLMIPMYKHGDDRFVCPKIFTPQHVTE